MKIFAVLGSRNPDGQTAQATAALLDGAREKGCRTDLVRLPERAIERCRQCEANGWGACRAEGRCVIEDDFAGLVEDVRGSDAVVFATPVYFSDLSESMRAFLDRLRRITRHEATRQAFAGKPTVGICVAGGGGGGAPACAVALERVLTTCGFDVLDMVPAHRQNLPMKCQVLRTVGAWLAEQAMH